MKLAEALSLRADLQRGQKGRHRVLRGSGAEAAMGAEPGIRHGQFVIHGCGSLIGHGDPSFFSHSNTVIFVVKRGSLRYNRESCGKEEADER